MRWQRIARYSIAAGAAVVAILVAFSFTRRTRVDPPLPPRADPGAVVESTRGRVERFKSSRQDIHVEYERQLTYASGATKLMGVTIVTQERGGNRRFTVTAQEGALGEQESRIALTGDVRLSASDGLAVRTDHATYADADGIVRADGAVSFTRGRMSGSGVGMTYDVKADTLTVLDQIAVQVAPDADGADEARIAAGSLVMERKNEMMRFERNVRLERGRQTAESDITVAHLSADGDRVEAMELRGHSSIRMADPTPGALQSLNATDMDLKYAADGQTIQHAALNGSAGIVVAGERGAAGRQISANTLDVTLADDGNPTALTGREAVVLTLPAEADVPARTIRSQAIDAQGEAGRGLTRAVFDGAVQYVEKGAAVSRTAAAPHLEVALQPAMSGIDDATFSRVVCFTDGGTPAADPCAVNGGMAALAATGRYNLAKGVLELSGTDRGAPRPHVVNERISVDAAHVDVTLAGPKVKATGDVKSVLRPSKGGGSSEGKLPAMFKQDKPVNVTAASLDYDGAMNHAVYSGDAQLWQDETSIKAATLVLDDKSGDLTGSGGSGLVTTVTIRDEVDKNKKPVRVRSVATSKDFEYKDAVRRATYTGTAHMSSPDGDMQAAKIELYLKSGGDDLERAEAYQDVTLHDQNRTTTGDRLTYTTADSRYVVSGAPVKIIDECRRETIGRTLTYLRDADVITIDGSDQRTQTKGAGQCP